jgi:flagellar basal body-associated protein FliL
MPPRLTPAAPARTGNPAPAYVPGPPAAPPPGLTPGTVTLFGIFLLAEALLVVALLHRVEGPTAAAPPADFSRQEYIDLAPVTVPVVSSRPGGVHLALRVEGSILATGDGAERARARDAVRDKSQAIADAIGKVVGEQTAEQAVDPGNRERVKDRIKAALNQGVFREEIAKEVVFRYYGP